MILLGSSTLSVDRRLRSWFAEALTSEPINAHRIVSTDPPRDSDFRTQLRGHATTKFEDISGSATREGSVIRNVADAAKRFTLPRTMFRFVIGEIRPERDFLSGRDNNPQKHRHANECMLRGLSIYPSFAAIENVRVTVGLERICALKLKDGAGKIKLTNPKTGDYTWWPFKDFDILANCEVLE